MIVSLNEVQATATKAVRACGHPVGIADDMGFAIRWLCARELPGVALLLAALDGYVPVEPLLAGGGDRLRLSGANGVPLSAVRVGMSVVELALTDESPRSVHVDVLTHPLLVVPFVARHGSGRLAVRWSTPEGAVVAESPGDGLRLRAQSTAPLTATSGYDVIVGAAPIGDSPPVLVSAVELQAAADRTLDTGCLVVDEEWERLERLAWRTYVPVSAESRLRGAGAGLTDND